MSADTDNHTDTALQATPLHALHLALGAKMVAFAGYAMPVSYPTGILSEHRQCRSGAALFDVSHMGQIRLRGAQVASALESLVPVDIVDLPVGMQRYALFTNPQGGILDDLMVAKLAEDELLLVVNAACKEQDLAHLRAHLAGQCSIEPLFAERALLALQGPAAAKVLARLAPSVAAMTFMQFAVVSIDGVDAYVSRSGYTGEDGFEISVPAEQAEALARRLLQEPEVAAIGLGARDSLRLEAGLCLYGNDIDTTTNPVEASLLWAMQKVRRAGGAREGGFPGATKILAALAYSTGANGQNSSPKGTRKRVGLIALERIPVRDHTELQDGAGNKIGEVTSGLLGPTIDKCVAMGYVDAAWAAVGARVVAIVRGKPVPMEVSAMPFVPTRYYRG